MRLDHSNANRNYLCAEMVLTVSSETIGSLDNRYSGAYQWLCKLIRRRSYRTSFSDLFRAIRLWWPLCSAANQFGRVRCPSAKIFARKMYTSPIQFYFCIHRAIFCLCKRAKSISSMAVPFCINGLDGHYHLFTDKAEKSCGNLENVGV